MRFYRLVLVCILAVIATQGLVLAQSQANTGTIEGIVNDPSGRAVAGAQVTVTNVGTNFTRNLTTDAEGRFRALLLPLGPYKVTVKAANFGTLVREGMDHFRRGRRYTRPVPDGGPCGLGEDRGMAHA